MKKSFIFYITLFLFIFAFSINVNGFDYDLWARLIAGMGVIDGGHVLTQDFLSYTPVHTWWDHEWGAGVIFYACLKYFGAYSLIILQALMLFGIFFISSRIIKLRSDISPYNIIFYLLAIMAVINNLNNPIRCHMFSFLFFTLFIYIFEKARKGDNKLLYITPLIILFWNNIHGGVVSGLGLMLMYALGEALNKKPFKKYLVAFVVSIPLLFINPWGYDYIKFLIMANTMPRPDIVEWWSIFSKYHMFKLMKFKLFMLAILSLESIYIIKKIKEYGKSFYEKADKTKYIIIASTTYLAISHVKLIPFFVIASLCFMYEDVYKLLQNVKLPVWKDKVIYSLIILMSVFTLSSRDITLPAGFNRYPVKEVEFIKINNLKGKLLVDFGYGSYAAYKLYPNNLIFMDGRYEEVYYDYMVPILKEFYLAREHWNYVLETFPPDIIIIQKYYPIFEKLKTESSWRLVYEGERFGVFLPENKSKKEYAQPTDNQKYYKDSLFDTDIKF